jgi:hypothetical protein
MRAAVVAIAILCASAPAHAQRRASTERICADLRLRETPIVDLYSFEVGPEIFEKFGHTMLCLTYPSYVPICFNYGVTDFSNPPKLMWGFLRSKQKFWVDGERLDSMLAFYGSPDADDFEVIPDGIPVIGRERCLVADNGDGTCGRSIDGEDRTIWRQRLPLTDDKARAIADKLCSDMEPENRFYIYHHFKDNCTTRLRDMLDAIYDGKLKDGTDKPYPLTFRQFAHRGLNEYHALWYISDFIGGRNLDHRPTEWEAMFHPDVLRQSVDDRLGIEPELIYQRRGAPFPTSGPSGRGWIILISLLLAAPLVVVRMRQQAKDRIAVTMASLPLMFWGVLLWAVFVVISIDWLRWNEALLLFVPTDLALPFLKGARRTRYAQVRLGMVVLASLLCAVGLFEQPLWVPALVAFLPLFLVAFPQFSFVKRRMNGTI